ncbi:MAG: hypothetical protein KIG95_05640 [Comamonas sp.]|nr:hypothetical protein [Comamonas sp.]
MIEFQPPFCGGCGLFSAYSGLSSLPSVFASYCFIKNLQNTDKKPDSYKIELIERKDDAGTGTGLR